MKRSKIVLGVSSLFLAIAAIAATKSNFTTQKGFVITTGILHKCVVFTAPCPVNGTLLCFTKGNTGAIVYTSSLCNIQLKRGTGTGN